LPGKQFALFREVIFGSLANQCQAIMVPEDTNSTVYFSHYHRNWRQRSLLFECTWEGWDFYCLV